MHRLPLGTAEQEREWELVLQLYPVVKAPDKKGEQADDEPSAEEPAKPDPVQEELPEPVDGETVEARRQLVKELRRVHQGLGHLETFRFVRILKAGGWNEQALRAVKKFKCATCQAFAQTKPWRRSAPPRKLGVNDVVGVAVIELETGSEKVRVLNIICSGSRFQLVIPLEKAYMHWIRIFGPPRRIFADQGVEFQGVFAAAAE